MLEYTYDRVSTSATCFCLLIVGNVESGNVSLGGLGAGRIAYWLEGCGLQNHTCGLFSLKSSCNNCAVNF